MAQSDVEVPPREGKNAVRTWPRHAPRSIHAVRYARSAKDGSDWSMLEVDVIQAQRRRPNWSRLSASGPTLRLRLSERPTTPGAKIPS